jgi:hypothetical protein
VRHLAFINLDMRPVSILRSGDTLRTGQRALCGEIVRGRGSAGRLKLA